MFHLPCVKDGLKGILLFELNLDEDGVCFQFARSCGIGRSISSCNLKIYIKHLHETVSFFKYRLRFSDAVVNDKESFGSVFASRYKRGPAEDVQTMQMHESMSYAGNKSDPRPNATSEQYVATVYVFSCLGLFTYSYLLVNIFFSEITDDELLLLVSMVRRVRCDRLHHHAEYRTIISSDNTSLRNLSSLQLLHSKVKVRPTCILQKLK